MKIDSAAVYNYSWAAVSMACL